MTDIIKTVGGRVRLYRQKAGLSQQELGERAGLHNTYIGQIERGEKNVSIEAIDKIIRALGVSYETFYAKLGGDMQQGRDTASECYDLIVKLDEKRQRQMLDIIRGVARILED